MPDWLHRLAIASLALCLLCALAIVVDLLSGRRQRMWIMNLVWPITALYSGPLGLWLYLTAGRAPAGGAAYRDHTAMQMDMKPSAAKPFWLLAATGTTRPSGISSIHLIAAAAGQGVPIYRITPANAAVVQPLLNLPLAVERDISDALAAGQSVLAPE